MIEDKIIAEKLVSSLIDDLYAASARQSQRGACDYSSESLSRLQNLRDLKPVWGIELDSFNTGQVDRKSNMFGGNPFTSKEYPWVVNESGGPCYPLIQLDLGHLSSLCNKNFGDGLLQIWLDIVDADLPSTIRVVPPEELKHNLEDDYPKGERIARVDQHGVWFSISKKYSFRFLGYMLPHWQSYLLESEFDRELSDEEGSIISRLEQLSEEHGYRGINASWLLGYPDRGSGSPAGRYDQEPLNLIQFATSDIFPMIGASRYGNVFYSEDQGEISYFFDWNG